MEFIIGGIFLLLLMVFLFFFCKNATFTIKIEYPDVQVPELNDIYDSEGEAKDDSDYTDFDNMLKEISDLMLDQEETNE